MKKKSTNQKNGLWTASYGEIGATLKALQDNGVTLEHLAQLRAEPKYAKRVAEYILRNGIKGSIHHKHARAIMGINFFGIEDWTALLFGTDISQKQFRGVPAFPWNEDILASTCSLCGKVIKDCHFAFLGFERINGQPLTILKLQEFYFDAGVAEQPRFYSYAPVAWYSKEKFATKTTMSSGWYLLHTSIIPKSEYKTYEKQKAMLPAEYEVPSAIVETVKNLFVFKKTCNYMDISRYARCIDISSIGDRVHVGFFGPLGLEILCQSDYNRYQSVGIAASRRPGV